MQAHTFESFYIIGLAVRTTNEHGQAMQDIPALWNRFFAENISARIGSKSSEDLYCVYTDYEKDYTKPYTTILGYRVESLDSIPEGLTGKAIPAGDYQLFTAQGKMADGIVYKEWEKIWNTELDRAYGADFEIYSAKAQDPENAEVEVYVGLNR